MTTKRCFCCGETKPLDGFYKHAKMKDGHLNKCVVCIKASATAHRLANLERIREYDRRRASMPHRMAKNARVTAAYNTRFPDRRKANVAVGNAVRDGRLEKWPCQVCGFKAVAHHPDYSRPLDVVWLCQPHHKQAHALIESTS